MLKNYKYKSDAELKKVLKTIEIIVDPREQANSHILDWFDKKKIPYRVETVSYGDYSFCLPKNEEYNIPRDLYFTNEIAIERKAHLDELATNFTKYRTRMEEEFAMFGGQMHLLIEGATYSDISNKNYQAKYNQKSYLATLHSFSQRYGFSYIFMPENTESAQYIAFTCYHYLRELLKK